MWEREKRKEGRKEGRREGGREGRKKGRKEGRRDLIKAGKVIDSAALRHPFLIKFNKSLKTIHHFSWRLDGEPQMCLPLLHREPQLWFSPRAGSQWGAPKWRLRTMPELSGGTPAMGGSPGVCPLRRPRKPTTHLPVCVQKPSGTTLGFLFLFFF